MEQLVESKVNEPTETWINKRCRELVFSVLDNIQFGCIDIVQGAATFSFPANRINSDSITGTIVIHDTSTYRDFVRGGSIGAAEAFIDGKWTSPNLTHVIQIFARAQQLTDELEKNASWLGKLKNVIFHRFNRNSQQGSKRNILAHYDLGNELYTRFLDPEMVYSAAIYPSEEASLAQAQKHKLDIICQRLSLHENDHLLEIGTGWGGLAVHAAMHYGCKVTTTTISDAQYAYVSDKIKALGLEDRITLLKEDYRALTGEYDKLVSIEMIEAVGYDYLPSFFQQCHDRLKPGGKLLIQSITIADQRFDYYRKNVDFIQRYIFPGGFLPSISELTNQLTKHTSLVMEELHDIGLHYAKTLADWRKAFLNAWPELSTLGYDEEFKRLWLYYFAYCEGAFLERSTSTVHLIARK
ncbi:cyclopropane-fatty-acyl-phospholipid synthase family protein [Thalassotalea sp. 1_MG-2023]|uniref:SAM-dependent methyltransferase n=1 Tax=Thalassotalea sp. 1_MG-2023 TaxID=3062680 RepID=UPI0026E342CE|nr:cyclopropane-fatty-acyl-phospholipid synthase family protein [Thalassotalea sp. 1_MG-2023]MDO6427891.1 cyclopropane-fatty-acyl-phospholipid synthase family protein [Thalassotalea sp. 1_MG-2023]